MNRWKPRLSICETVSESCWHYELSLLNSWGMRIFLSTCFRGWGITCASATSVASSHATLEALSQVVTSSGIWTIAVEVNGNAFSLVSAQALLLERRASCGVLPSLIAAEWRLEGGWVCGGHPGRQKERNSVWRKRGERESLKSDRYSDAPAGVLASGAGGCCWPGRGDVWYWEWLDGALWFSRENPNSSSAVDMKISLRSRRGSRGCGILSWSDTPIDEAHLSPRDFLSCNTYIMQDHYRHSEEEHKRRQTENIPNERFFLKVSVKFGLWMTR